MLDEILEKCKSYEDKKGLGYIIKTETPTNRDIIFVKGKKETPNHVAHFSTPPYYTYYKKSGQTHGRCYSRLFKGYRFHLNKLVGESNFLKKKQSYFE